MRKVLVFLWPFLGLVSPGSAEEPPLPAFPILSVTNAPVVPATNVSGNVAGILTNPNFQVVLHALQQRQGFETLKEPEVTTTSGRGENSMRVQDVVWNISVPASTNLPAAAGTNN